ncbi:helix-turn-helix domain-containing protein [Escherichia coli]|uniref:helix-turn-helix domain-containing protein n=1 Tax=Escherichia coli TaxID=562 RepID=UPI002FBDFEAC
MCFRELLLETRMKKAMSLLIEGELSVSQISTNIGYRSTLYFYITFQKIFRDTPETITVSVKKIALLIASN